MNNTAAWFCFGCGVLAGAVCIVVGVAGKNFGVTMLGVMNIGLAVFNLEGKRP